MRLAWLLAALVLAGALAYLQHRALAELWYWRFPWFDTIMHFLGGLTAATFTIGFIVRRRAFVFLSGMLGIAVWW